MESMEVDEGNKNNDQESYSNASQTNNSLPESPKSPLPSTSHQGPPLSPVVAKDSVMASPGTVGSVSVSLHPLVILNISEHWTRQKAPTGKPCQVLGALIGKQTGRNVEIMNSFELCYDNIDGHSIIINRDYYCTKEEQYKQVFSELDLLGWYTTGDKPTHSDVLVHKQICDLLESPIFLKLNPLARHTDLPVSIYESVLDIVNGIPTMFLVELQYTLATEEAERIGVDHVARMSSHDTQKVSLVAENLQAQCNAIKMLASRVRLIVEFVHACEKGAVPFDHEILRQVNSLAHRLPVLNNDKFRSEFYNQTNDVALMSYLGSITKTCDTMNRYINRFSFLYETKTMARRMRGLFF